MPGGGSAGPNDIHPVVDPVSLNVGRGMIFRGGADDSGTFDLRAAFYHGAALQTRQTSLGFRVVCAASAPDSPPAVAPPPDVSALWMWAAGIRPKDPVLVSRATEYAIRAGHEQARHLRFAEAETSFTRAVELRPGDIVTWYFVAALRLHLGDMTGYQAACKAMLEISTDAEVDSTSERTAKAMLLDRTLKPSEKLDDATEQAAKAVRLGGESPNLGWFVLTEGMAAYRAGKYADAVEILKKTRINAHPAQCLTDLFLAMAQHRSGQTAEARQTLDGAFAIIRGEAPANSADWGEGWIDWLGCRIAMSEAESVLATPAATQPVKAGKP